MQFGAREGFLAWAYRRLPPGATVYFECKGDSACGGGGLPQWVTFRLIPRRFVERRDDAEWVLVNGASSAVERESRLASSPYERFGRGFGLGRLRR